MSPYLIYVQADSTPVLPTSTLDPQLTEGAGKEFIIKFCLACHRDIQDYSVSVSHQHSILESPPYSTDYEALKSCCPS